MQLQTSKKGSLSITDYYMRIKNIVNNLIAAGTFITDEEICLYLLGGLGSEYDPVVINITAKETMPSLEKIYSLLLTHESRLEQMNCTGLIEPTTNYAGYFQKGTGNNNIFGRVHNHNNRANNRGRGHGRSRGRNSSKPTCQVCNRYGHSASVCYYRFDRNYSS